MELHNIVKFKKLATKIGVYYYFFLSRGDD
jgi:hypothetical protein